MRHQMPEPTPVVWAEKEHYDEILRLKRGITPGQAHLTDDEIRELIREQELYEPDCLSLEAAQELIDNLRERYDFTRNRAKTNEDGEA